MVLLIGIVVSDADAELRVAGILTDYMVLQRSQPIYVWGWTQNGDLATVAFAVQSNQMSANQKGK